MTAVTNFKLLKAQKDNTEADLEPCKIFIIHRALKLAPVIAHLSYLASNFMEIWISNTEAYSEPCQTTKIELFAQIVN